MDFESYSISMLLGGRLNTSDLGRISYSRIYKSSPNDLYLHFLRSDFFLLIENKFLFFETTHEVLKNLTQVDVNLEKSVCGRKQYTRILRTDQNCIVHL